ncbi:alpha/beta hydrolase [Rhizobium deserti]|uniref:Alpha/beta hydrolase n=1 Tax=Rhizobium deserti TaxID=2547961 RepID=A0A4R5UJ36_9HYPH|nr:alpha/beta fold hydrolase [Rhizobium deserti]TDK36836.1 alpha/beta hydrolase [Rhizobium deserti]
MTAPHKPIAQLPPFDAARLGADLDAYLAAAEGGFTDIRPSAAKRIVWANPALRQRRPVALVYVHGFSAAAEEVRPLPDMVAAALGANLYFARLCGHGRSSQAMGEASLAGWFADLAESLKVGEALGERVVLIGTSTGASLITAALADPTFSHRITATVFLSPNYGINKRGASLLTLPFAALMIRLLLGRIYSFKPANAEHAAHWTTSYPSSALLPMAALVKLAVSIPAEVIGTPALFLYSAHDQVVRPDQVRHVASRWGGRHEIVEVGETGDPSNHVIAGAILSPQTTVPLASRIIDWLRTELYLR